MRSVFVLSTGPKLVTTYIFNQLWYLKNCSYMVLYTREDVQFLVFWVLKQTYDARTEGVMRPRVLDADLNLRQSRELKLVHQL